MYICPLHERIPHEYRIFVEQWYLEGSEFFASRTCSGVVRLDDQGREWGALK